MPPYLSPHRLRHTVQKLLDGKQPVKIGVVGGSITFTEPHQQMKMWFGKLVCSETGRKPNPPMPWFLSRPCQCVEATQSPFDTYD
jgi:hypothetical protein